MSSRARIEALAAAALEQREAACASSDSEALIDATGAAFRAKSLLGQQRAANPWPLDPQCPPARRYPAGGLDLLDAVREEHRDRNHDVREESHPAPGDSGGTMATPHTTTEAHRAPRRSPHRGHNRRTAP